MCISIDGAKVFELNVLVFLYINLVCFNLELTLVLES